MDEATVICNEAGENLSEVRSSPVHDPSFWDKKASSFSEYAAGTGYAEEFMKIMDIDPDWTVFDMACAGGTLAIPLAGRVKRITAVDFSRNMLSVLKWRCVENCITNVDVIHGRWEDDWDALGSARTTWLSLHVHFCPTMFGARL